uniref:Uncharacterized protein n=1 Tax=Trichogramma kaykai TaxID=54128 RepID=A0ABD2WL98_9HYME
MKWLLYGTRYSCPFIVDIFRDRTAALRQGRGDFLSDLRHCVDRIIARRVQLYLALHFDFLYIYGETKYRLVVALSCDIDSALNSTLKLTGIFGIESSAAWQAATPKARKRMTCCFIVILYCRIE